MKNVLFFSLFAGLLLVSGCRTAPSPPIDKPVPVKVGKALEKDVPVYVEVIGNVISPNTVQLKAQVDGMLLSTHVEEGGIVKKGQLLFTIDPRPYKAALEKAKATLLKDEASLAFAKKQLDRYEGLVKKDYIPKLTYDQYISAVETAKAQVAEDKADIISAKIKLNWCFIRSL